MGVVVGCVVVHRLCVLFAGAGRGPVGRALPASLVTSVYRERGRGPRLSASTRPPRLSSSYSERAIVTIKKQPVYLQGPAPAAAAVGPCNDVPDLGKRPDAIVHEARPQRGRRVRGADVDEAGAAAHREAPLHVLQRVAHEQHRGRRHRP